MYFLFSSTRLYVSLIPFAVLLFIHILVRPLLLFIIWNLNYLRNMRARVFDKFFYICQRSVSARARAHARMYVYYFLKDFYLRVHFSSLDHKKYAYKRILLPTNVMNTLFLFCAFIYIHIYMSYICYIIYNIIYI